MWGSGSTCPGSTGHRERLDVVTRMRAIQTAGGFHCRSEDAGVNPYVEVLRGVEAGGAGVRA